MPPRPSEIVSRITNLKVDSRLDPLRADPRFATLLARVGLAASR